MRAPPLFRYSLECLRCPACPWWGGSFGTGTFGMHHLAGAPLICTQQFVYSGRAIDIVLSEAHEKRRKISKIAVFIAGNDIWCAPSPHSTLPHRSFNFLCFSSTIRRRANWRRQWTSCLPDTWQMEWNLSSLTLFRHQSDIQAARSRGKCLPLLHPLD